MDNVHKLSLLTKLPNPSKSTYLRRKGFATADDEYEFFFNTESDFVFEFPDNKIRSIQAYNYYWEAMYILEAEFDLPKDKVISDVWDLHTKSFKNGDFDEELKNTLIYYIEDNMEEYRRKNDLID